MRFILLAGALAALASSAPAAADSTVVTYHGALDRSGKYVMPGLTYERARGLRPDFSFDSAYRGEVYAQPLLWRDPKTGAGELIVATEEDEVYAFDEKTGRKSGCGPSASPSGTPPAPGSAAAISGRLG
jgi:hypothetical protein